MKFKTNLPENQLEVIIRNF